VVFQLPDPIRNAPAALDGKVQCRLLDAMERAGQQRYDMPSGGGHDAAVFSNAGVPAGMVFVRSKGGSHNPAESMTPEDMMAGAAIFLAHVSAED
jgi:N-carbamoyl-L-amino-acid hydrolase